VPLVVGDAAPQQVAQLLRQLWDGPETLIVASSDLSQLSQLRDCTASGFIYRRSHRTRRMD
jgi:AmmeMemoRadiSam system protein B